MKHTLYKLYRATKKYIPMHCSSCGKEYKSKEEYCRDCK